MPAADSFCWTGKSQQNSCQFTSWMVRYNQQSSLGTCMGGLNIWILFWQRCPFYLNAEQLNFLHQNITFIAWTCEIFDHMKCSKTDWMKLWANWSKEGVPGMFLGVLGMIFKVSFDTKPFSKSVILWLNQGKYIYKVVYISYFC